MEKRATVWVMMAFSFSLFAAAPAADDPSDHSAPAERTWKKWTRDLLVPRGRRAPAPRPRFAPAPPEDPEAPTVCTITKDPRWLHICRLKTLPKSIPAKGFPTACKYMLPDDSIGYVALTRADLTKFAERPIYFSDCKRAKAPSKDLFDLGSKQDAFESELASFCEEVFRKAHPDKADAIGFRVDGRDLLNDLAGHLDASHCTQEPTSRSESAVPAC